MGQPVLKTTHLTKSYNRLAALDDVNLVIEEGEIYGLVGHNGAGKTTLMRLVAGLSFADSGEIELFGETTEEGLTRARRRMGSIVETPVFYPNLTARQNLQYYQIQRGIPENDKVEDTLGLVNLTDTGDKKFRDFSSGMKQRLGLALAVLNRPDFIMLDEPINGLDPTGIVEIRNTIKQLNTCGITFLVSSHILNELSLLATRYGFIHQGKLIKEITKGDLQEACRRALHIEVDDTVRAVSVLETHLDIHDYKVVSPNAIRLYSQFGRAPSINACLVNEGLRVSCLFEVGENLEDYYTALIGEGK